MIYLKNTKYFSTVKFLVNSSLLATVSGGSAVILEFIGGIILVNRCNN